MAPLLRDVLFMAPLLFVFLSLTDFPYVRLRELVNTAAKIPSAINMFLSNVAFHPGFSPSSKRLSLKSFSLKKSPPTTPPRGSISHSQSCELWILSALQGSSASFEDRQRVAQDLELLTSTEKDQLIEFIQAENGAAHCALENNACKAFQCQASELSFQRLENDTEAMLDMWATLYQTTIPALQSMLYPLTRHRADFDIRKSVLAAFRDKVLLKMLSSTSRLAELEAMLFIVLLETHDDSETYKLFSHTAQQAMGLPKPTSEEHKCRARTLTSKRVTWHDEDDRDRKLSTHTA